MRAIQTKKSILTTGDVSAICGVSHRMVCEWIDRGILPGWKLPSTGKAGIPSRRVSSADLRKFMVEHKISRLDELNRVCGTGTLCVLVVGAQADWQEFAARWSVPKQALESDGRFHIALACDLFHAGLQTLQLWPQLVVLDLEIPEKAREAAIESFGTHGAAVRFTESAGGDFPDEPTIQQIVEAIEDASRQGE